MTRAVYTVIAIVAIALSLRLIAIRYVQEPAFISSASTSLDKRYHAYVYTDSGGGSGFGWCQTKISVYDFQRVDTLSRLLGRETTVFHIDSCVDGFEVEWSSTVRATLEIRCPSLEGLGQAGIFVKESSLGELNLIYAGCPEGFS